MPKASAAAWAKQLATNASWRSPAPGESEVSTSGRANTMKSVGTTVVPWCRNWWKECWLSVPVPPHTTSLVSHPTALPSSRTRLPLDSITTCCNQLPNLRSRCEYGTTARDCKPQKLRYHTPNSPISTGALADGGCRTRCSSTARIPASISPNRSSPMASMSDSPAAEPSEQRPPTQSHIVKTSEVAMPNSVAAVAFAVAAAKW